MRYHNQCISPGNVLYGTKTSAFHQYTGCGTVRHIARLHWSWYRMTLPGERHWSLYRITHCQVKYTGCGTVWHIARVVICLNVSRYHDQCLAPSNVSYGTTTSVFHLAMCYAVPQPVQPRNMPYGTTTSEVKRDIAVLCVFFFQRFC
jgi:hypothetical protein